MYGQGFRLNFMNVKQEYKSQVNMKFFVLYYTVLSSHKFFAGPRMACFTVQQQPKWNSSR